jgi:hypothetical protein
LDVFDFGFRCLLSDLHCLSRDSLCDLWSQLVSELGESSGKQFVSPFPQHPPADLETFLAELLGGLPQPATVEDNQT